jgi:hypothetical protein
MSWTAIDVKITPRQPEPSSNENVEMEDDFSKEKYRHTVANHMTFLQGICRLPFNIFECTAFLDFAKAPGLDFSSKVPSQDEVQKGLDLRRAAYPDFLTRRKTIDTPAQTIQPTLRDCVEYPSISSSVQPFSTTSSLVDLISPRRYLLRLRYSLDFLVLCSTRLGSSTMQLEHNRPQNRPHLLPSCTSFTPNPAPRSVSFIPPFNRRTNPT